MAKKRAVRAGAGREVRAVGVRGLAKTARPFGKLRAGRGASHVDGTEKQVPHRVCDSVRNDKSSGGCDSVRERRGKQVPHRLSPVRNDKSSGVCDSVRNDKVGVRARANHAGCPRKSVRIGHPNRKRLGEASEAAFVARAIGFNFPVAKLWGDSDASDTLVGFGSIYWRVQVKCAQSCVDGKYKVKAGGLNYSYTKADIDFLAAHIVPENIWYIIPVEAFQGQRMLCFRPDGRGERKFEKYREAWCLLACEPEERGRRDVPQKCRCPDLPVRCAVCPEKKSK